MNRRTLAAALATVALGACATGAAPDRAAWYAPRVVLPFGYFSTPPVRVFPPAAQAVPAKDADQQKGARFDARIDKYLERQELEKAQRGDLERTMRDHDLYPSGPAQPPAAGGKDAAGS